MKIYTKSGDKGMSSLYDGTRLDKTDPTFETLGQIDHLIALIGSCTSLCNTHGFDFVHKQLTNIQCKLMAISSEIANAQNVRDAVTETDIAKLETEIDRFTDETKPLTVFILPGGSQLGSQLHIVRTQVRTIERRYLSLPKQLANQFNGPYLNRLSDYFFSLARWINEKLEKPEPEWC